MTGRRIWWQMMFLGAVLVAMTACSGDEAERECETDQDCEENMVCDATLGVCETQRSGGITNASIGGGGSTGGGTSNGGGSTGNDGGNNNTTDPPPPPPNSTSGGNDPESGCTQEFDACDPSDVDQGSFVCLEVEDGQGACFRRCDTAGEPSTCPIEQFCLDSPEGPICAPSECDVHTDCEGGGTCIDIGNSYSFCREDGTGAEGSSCTGGEDGQCQQGLACDAAEGEFGECRTVCHPWDVDPCGLGQVCAMAWSHTGMCIGNETTTGSQSFDSCTPEGAWCNDGTRCFGLDTENVCIKYCRADMMDCPMDAVCNEQLVPGLAEIGLCLPPCEINSDCAEGFECVDQRCREPCFSDTDCCDAADPDCPWECVGGYCG